MNEDMKTLTEKIEKMFQEHGYTTQRILERKR